MKTLRLIGLLVSVSLGTLALSAQQPAESPQAQIQTNTTTAALTNAPPESVTPSAPANATVETAPSVATNALPGSVPTPAGTTSVTAAAPTNAVAPATTNAASAATEPPTAVPEYTGDKGLRLNFRNVPLDMVLNYLSAAAGFIIVQETKVEGKVDVWSQEPLSKEEAVDLLNTILNKNGYAAVRNGRKLTIVSREDAKKRDLPVKVSSDPESIPKNDEMVTQILPVRYANALQMTKDLQPLLPTYATMTANESGNALVITDTQADIRRMAQIIKALDTSISGISTIRVFPLRYADAKDIATELKEIFPAPDTSGRNNMGGRGQFGRFGGPGGFPGGQADPTVGTGQSEARKAASRVTAVADERTNALIVSAPDEVMPTIEQLVKEIDTNAENITEVRVFHLSYSDPQEMADLLTSLFPDDTRNDTRSAVMFGGGRGGRGGPFMGMMGGATSSTPSTRSKQKGKVVAVPDPRTASVIVSAASDLMPQIAEMVAQLDSNPAKKQNVYVYPLENADVDSVVQVLQDMFQSQNNRNNRSLQNNNNPLTSRQQNQGYGNTTSGFGSNSGFGNTGGSRGGGS
jgi:type II secretory pathway component GspD/PulD (secretin)